jgi:hypothetical protein
MRGRTRNESAHSTRKSRREGFSPWLDEEDLIGGQTWEVEVEKAICESGVFITCLSENSISKHGFVQKELRLALAEYGKRRSGSILFIPVKLDECDIPDLSIPISSPRRSGGLTGGGWPLG